MVQGTREGAVLLNRIREDISAVMERDPAAYGVIQVVLTYSGLHAIWMYRLAHKLWRKKMFTVARVVSQLARFLTGIEIHPGASIGRRLFIDHGNGVVIGETTEIGDDVTIYQGVTLGGTGKDVGKRHPTIGNHVFISAGAKILGPIVIADNSKVGAGAVVLRSVPPNCTVVGIPGKVVMQDGLKVNPFEHTNLPDPVADIIEIMQNEIRELRLELSRLRDEDRKSHC